MLTIPADLILEKNKLFSGDSVIELIEAQLNSGSNIVRIANHNEDVEWGSETWTKFRFDGGDETDEGGGEEGTVRVFISAIDKTVQGYLEALSNGGIGDTVIYRRIHTANTDNERTDVVLSAQYEILEVDCGPSNEFVIFDLGRENFFLSQFPAHVLRRDVCRYRPWMTSVCSYVNNSACDRSFASCAYFEQTSVFGGQPGVPGGAFNLLAEEIDHGIADTSGTAIGDTTGEQIEDTAGDSGTYIFGTKASVSIAAKNANIIPTSILVSKASITISTKYVYVTVT